MLADHPQRYAMSNELHARPAPVLPYPCTAVLLATKLEHQAAARDRGADRAALTALLDRAGVAHPAPGASHHAAELGQHGLRWENHTEFTTYFAHAPGLAGRPFDPSAFEVFPSDWMASLPGVRVTSILFRVEEMPMIGDEPDTATMSAALDAWFVGESLAAGWALEGVAVVASDFRIDPSGHVRMAVYVRPGTGPRRVGRIVQRLGEIETYRGMSMLGLARVRAIGAEMGALDRRLSDLVEGMAGSATAEGVLADLMALSESIERVQVATSYRFGATEAYEALVHDRIEVLRAERFDGRQTLTEFMRRRYDPAMRTVRAARARLTQLSDRATRAGRLLSTQVEVARSAQNQALLKSMDQRADLQLRLQHTVEGLSVVAISYYALGLVAYVVKPMVSALGLPSGVAEAALVPVVVLAVWWGLRRLRRAFTHHGD